MKGVRMSKLFSPIRIGAIDLSHRVVLAPLTRMRADLPGNVPNDLMTKYYGQRASQGGLMITEATFISPTGNGGYASPGIFTDAQVAGWRKIVDAVHAKGAKILLQRRLDTPHSLPRFDARRSRRLGDQA
jgi:N-ethylmaleimide reductase